MTETKNNERTKFQEVIIQILNNNDRGNEFEMNVGDYIKLEDEVFMTLVIERVTDKYLSVAHHKKQNGDTMKDPEIVFDISHDPWLPVAYEQSGLHYEEDPDGIQVDDFLELWGSNLDKQGFTEKTGGLDAVPVTG
jgi:hypothetical protein